MTIASDPNSEVSHIYSTPRVIYIQQGRKIFITTKDQHEMELVWDGRNKRPYSRIRPIGGNGDGVKVRNEHLQWT